MHDFVTQGPQSNGCQNYRYERRSSQDCVGYQPPGGGKNNFSVVQHLLIIKIHKLLKISATVFGDPHVYTFDGLEYTFNGKGEYVMVRADSPR